ncbi:aminopeptidase P family protein, partial [Candidatus Thorarchaeota archaeon]
VGLVIPSSDEPFLVAPSFEVSNLQELTWIEDILPWEEDEDPYELVASRLGHEGGAHGLFDSFTPLGVFWEFNRKVHKPDRTGLISPFIEAMRLVKGDKELDLMKRAGRVIDSAVMGAFESATVGMTEIEMRQLIHEEIVRNGASPTFAAIQFGENSAKPHAEPGTRELRAGDIVLLDCGCSISGYNTDMTRVAVVGEPTAEQERVYSVVLKAQRTAIETIHSGMTCGAADGIARKVIDESGYGEFFTHRLGHGIGLQVHEPPYLVRGNSNVLEPGMCHSIEPGIYLPNRFGIRIEDLVTDTDDGVEVLTYSPKSLVQIEI